MVMIRISANFMARFTFGGQAESPILIMRIMN